MKQRKRDKERKAEDINLSGFALFHLGPEYAPSVSQVLFVGTACPSAQLSASAQFPQEWPLVGLRDNH